MSASAPWPAAVIFDLDGTLVDTVADIASSTNDLLQTDGLAAFDLEEVRGFIGHGIRRLVQRAYAARGQPLEERGLDDKVAVFRDIYLGRIAERSRPYPGAIELLKELRGQGIKTGICTNKVEPLTNALLEALRLTAMFDAVVGGSGKIAAKPAADMLLETMRQLGCAAADAIMIGDSETDVATARAAGVPFVGVTFGYTEIPMRELGPDVVIDAFSEAPAAIATLRKAAG